MKAKSVLGKTITWLSMVGVSGHLVQGKDCVVCRNSLSESEFVKGEMCHLLKLDILK